jgi:hypothetical protein
MKTTKLTYTPADSPPVVGHMLTSHVAPITAESVISCIRGHSKTGWPINVTLALAPNLSILDQPDPLPLILAASSVPTMPRKPWTHSLKINAGHGICPQPVCWIRDLLVRQIRNFVLRTWTSVTRKGLRTLARMSWVKTKGPQPHLWRSGA